VAQSEREKGEKEKRSCSISLSPDEFSGEGLVADLFSTSEVLIA
jgi:hypothetical protein